MSFDKKYLICALLYAMAGMALGLVMAASQNHRQLVTHAHALLVGFVVSTLYAVIHRLWLPAVNSKLARAQFYAHQAGAVTMVSGLYLLYGAVVSSAILDPILAIGSSAVLAGAATMLLLVVRAHRIGGAVPGPNDAQNPSAHLLQPTRSL